MQSFKHNGVNNAIILTERRNKIDPDVDIYQGDRHRKATGQLRKAKKHFKKCRNEIRKLRNEYLKRKTEEEAMTDKNKDATTIVKSIKHHEEKFRMYKIMQRYLKPESDGGTMFIMVPDQENFRNNAQQAMSHYEQEDNQQLCTILKIIYLYLLEHHNRHFGQVRGTPFMVSPLKELIQYTAEGPLARKLKQGKANIEKLNVSTHTKDILHEFQWKETDPPKNSEELDWRQVQKGFQLWNKQTATSLLG
eukprot:6589774-Ditylum_brightwellii.AAC.1